MGKSCMDRLKTFHLPTLEDIAGKIYDILFPLPKKERHIYINDLRKTKKKGKRFCGNKVTTAKYNLLTFLPKNLLEQFQRVANLYFLLVSMLQLFSGLSPTGRYGTAVPLFIVVVAQMLKDIYEDFFRHREDWRTNGAKAFVYRKSKGQLKLKKIKWKQVRVGDLIKVHENDYFPADIICLGCQSKKMDKEGNNRRDLCYIETSQLDGETNLKIRKPFKGSQNTDPEEYSSLKGILTAEAPNPQVYSFTGKITLGDDLEAPLGPESMLLRGSQLRNTDWIIGIVVYTGRHTKLRLNARRSPHKRSKIERRTNFYLFSIFLLQWIITILCIIYLSIWTETQKDNYWYIFWDYSKNGAVLVIENIITFFILFNNFIPISLYVSMEMVKLLQARWFMNSDIGMYYAPKDAPCEVKSSSLNEELGQVEYIFSDKTGTLTQNKMELLKFGVNGKVYGFFPNEESEHNERDENWKPEEDGFQFYDKRILGDAWKEQEDATAIEEFLKALAICHDVIPEKDRVENKYTYTSPSPDENALVKAAQHFGFTFTEKTITHMKVRIEHLDDQLEYKLLNVLDFDSTRKRMSVIVETPEGKIMLYIKGADNVIKKRLRPGQPHWPATDAALSEMAKTGLRTLVVARTEIKKAAYETWKNNYYHPASIASVERKKKLRAAYDIVEKNLTLVGITAIEDKLQDGVPDTIANLARAGIKIWVLTGDKLETAINIGKSCKMIVEGMNLMVLNYDDKKSKGKSLAQQRQEISDLIEESYAELKVLGRDSDNGLVITGHALNHIIPVVKEKKKKKKKKKKPPKKKQPTDGENPEDLEMEQEEEEEKEEEEEEKEEEIPQVSDDLKLQFLRLCMLCRSVVCCRVTPLQKSQIVLLVRENLKGPPITLAIGDGANDVSMIQAAHIGVGISGEEGLQAAKAADYAIAQFAFLQRLLLVHGRWNYRRIAKLICYSFYKNAIVQLCNFYYIFWNLSGTSLYENSSLSLFNVTWASLPIMVMALFDKDVKAKTALNHPELYYDGPSDYFFNLSVFLQWMTNAIWQSVIIYFCTYAVFSTSGMLNQDGHSAVHELMGMTIYTSIIIVVNFKIFVDSASWSIVHHLSIWGSLLLWVLFLCVYGVTWYMVPKWNFWPVTEVEATTRNQYFTFFDAATCGVFWLTILFNVVASLMKDIIWKALKRALVQRKFYHVMQEIERRKYITPELVEKRFNLKKLKSRNRKLKLKEKKRKNRRNSLLGLPDKSTAVETMIESPVPSSDPSTTVMASSVGTPTTLSVTPTANQAPLAPVHPPLFNPGNVGLGSQSIVESTPSFFAPPPPSDSRSIQ